MRLLRIVRASVGILSLLLCLAIAIVWIRSYFVADYFFSYHTYDVGGRSYRPIHSFEIGSGGIGYSLMRWQGPKNTLQGPEMPMTHHWDKYPIYPKLVAYGDKRDYPVLGFKFDRNGGRLPNGATERELHIIVPFWFLLLLSVVPATPCILHLFGFFRPPKRPLLQLRL